MEPRQTISARVFNVLAVGLTFAAYWLALTLTYGGGPLHMLPPALTNTATLVLLAVAVRALLKTYVASRSAYLQLLAHAVLALLFSILWYWLLLVVTGMQHAESTTQFSVEAFLTGGDLVWQLIQGVSFYSLIALVTHVQAQNRAPMSEGSATIPPERPSEPTLSRYLIRKGEEIHPVDVTQIVSITGADDYVEVATTGGHHLVRMRLAEFEQALRSNSFLRVHRSSIVNIDRLVRAEPAGGGRMLLHMENGESVAASRAGAKLLRDRVI